ncbi:MAG: hypothetical protein R6W68_12605 [Ignavibacteriaceae bacterium]
MKQILYSHTEKHKTGIVPLSLFVLLVMMLIFITSCSEITSPEDVFPPATPRNFTLIGGGDGQAHFRWEKNIEIDLKGYRLYRSVNNINNFILLVEIIQTEYVDRFLEYDSVYYYYLTAIDFTGNESSPTNIIDIQPLNLSAPQPPSRVIVSGYNSPVQGSLEMQISWTPPDIGDLKNYYVFRNADSSFIPGPSSFIDSSNIALYIDRTAQLNTDYYYKIIAVDRGFKASLPSKAVKDKILSSPLLVSPANNTRFGAPHIFKWNPVNNAVHYEVFVGNAPFSDVFWSSGKIAETEFAYNGPAFQTSKVYYWWVGVYSKEKIIFEDGSELPAQVNAYSLINSFFSE